MTKSNQSGVKAVNNYSWDEDILSVLAELQFYCPLILEEQTQDYTSNLFESGYTNNGFYNNLYLNMYLFYIFILHSYLVRIYKFSMDDKSLHILQKMKIIAKKEKDELKLETIKHNIFNSLEKDSLKHIAFLLNCEDDTNFSKRHSDIFMLRDNICHFNEIKISKEIFFEHIDKILENLNLIQKCIYKQTKQLIYDEIEQAVNNNLIDESNYELYFEQLNLSYYLNYFDYISLMESGYFSTIEDNETKKFMFKYAEKVYYA